MEELKDIQKQDTSIINVGKVDNDAAMTQMWGLTPAIIQEINKSAMVRSSKHGMFASVPIICKGPDCAYYDTCSVDIANRTPGQRCPLEIGAIIARFNHWCAHFGLDTTGDTILDEEAVDASLIRDLVNIEVQMIRCENKVALSGDFMGKTLLDIDKACKPYFGDIITPESEFLLTLQEKKIKVLNQLNATRKDKAKDKAQSGAPTEVAIKLFQSVQEAIKNKTIVDIDEVNFDEVDMEDLAEFDNNTELNLLITPSDTMDNVNEQEEI